VACVALICAGAAIGAKTRPKTHTHTPETDPPANGRVVDVRFWSLQDATRIAIEVSGDFEYQFDRLASPDRLFFDIPGFTPARNPRGIQTIPVGDGLVKQIRVAQSRPGATRVVLDLAKPIDFSASQLSNPNRLMIELRPVTAGDRAPATVARTFQPPVRPAISDAALAPVKLSPPKPVNLPAPAPNPVLERAATVTVPPPPDASLAKRSEMPVASPKPDLATSTPKSSSATAAFAAKRTSSGDQSVTRVLGLKLRRVVLDPGHGGHDCGTQGASGLLEKDLVLDVTKRLGALIEARLGSEVIYTRSDDTFIPLEERTHIANEHKADLFLSIHANSSPVRSVSGVETYYLNFTSSKSALEVAARENAASERSIYELRDLVQKIALKEKLDESREFASRVQTSLSTLSARTNSASKDRGVRRAPFVVLIGASMPSALAEIGFVTNSRDESQMKKPEYRQRIAEALYKGVAQYAASLSHFQVAQRTPTDE
jgi:N-acetylmuramoyl-L-alanine amidase